VQGLTRELGAEVLVTRAVRDALDSRFRVRALAPARLRGIAEPIEVFEVPGFDAGRG
jgi:class 3 adenylate cyclase